MRVPTGARRTTLAGGTALLLTLALAPSAGADSPRRADGRGSLVLVGGGLKADNTQVYGEIIKRAGGASARIGVITAASVPASQDPHASDPDACSNSECNGAYYANQFERHGAADAQWIPVDLDHIANSDSDEVVRQVKSMTGFFFGGGDQYRYVTTLLHGSAHTDSKVLAAIRAQLAAGAVVSGSSAGAQIAAGADMVTGGDSYEGLRDGSSPGYFDDATRLGYLPAGGFGFLRSGLIDTHTGAYGREGRALRLAADTGNDRVYALEENTALIVEAPRTPHERLRVLGPRGVAVLDLRQARPGRTSSGGWSLTGARYNYLTDGDEYDPNRWRVLPAPGKRPLIPTSTSPVPANPDVFCSAANPAGVPYSFLGTARALAASSTQRTAAAATFESGPRFTVTFSKQPGFTAWTGDGATARTIIGLRTAVAPQ
ncbi:cyanophycinase [Streptomyces yangpuensis]|uniref:Cyanophycinase n=1 Tax=Streptomyces yangpuensis TaxID=1648182 RepID=A0ABY5Q432_9ACTN|nr:cyanophycinase [Streptomyces yangpuensis]UUY50390.1 cyanophycinase [Streptomyces yangpuensis]